MWFGLVAGALAASSSLLPPVGATLTFIVSSHTDVPRRMATQMQSAPSPSPDDPYAKYRAMLRDQKGTLTLRRSAADSVQIVIGGDLDPIQSPLAITETGAIDPGTSPNRFIVCFDNGVSMEAGLTTDAKVGTQWSSAIEVPTQNDTLQSFPVTVKVTSVSGDDLKLEATGQGTMTVSTPRGERTVNVNVAGNEEFAAGRLSAFTQTVKESLKTPYRTMTITNVTSLTAQ